MSQLDTQLFQVFERLRRKGVPLGVGDYLVVMETIQAGFGLEDFDSFKGLCRLLWAKSREDQELFDIAFKELLEPYLQSTLKANTNNPKLSHPENKPSPTDSQSSTKSPNPVENVSQSKQQSKQEVQLQTVKLPETRDNQSFILQPSSYQANHQYQLTPRLPISKRDMAAIWRQLRRPQRVGVPEELNIEATINSVCRTGMLLHPVLQPRRRNLASLVILVDTQGSMAPFALLIEAVVESILRGGLGKTSLYYFHNYPKNVVYQRPNLTRAVPLKIVLDEEIKGNSVLIISDAGAARGYYSGTRVEETKKFIQTLNNYTYLFAWLNPMPQKRWLATTAEDIADEIEPHVPMFPLDREGLNDTVNILRGIPCSRGQQR
jgi:uncharacterized protein